MITSPRNPRIAAAARLKKRPFRDTDGRFLVEGAQAVTALLDAGGEPDVLFVTDPQHPLAIRAAQQGVDVEPVSEAVMERLTSTVTPQGLVAVTTFIDVPIDAAVTDAPCVAVVCAGRDPGNAGSVVRSTDAAGGGAVVFTDESVDIYNPKTVRSTAGSLFNLRVARAVPVEEAVSTLRARGFTILATASSDEGEDLFDTDLASEPVAFLFGNEAWGLPAETAALADRRVRVPISGGAESLNLAAAAAVCLFEWSRQRRAAPGPAEGVAASDDLAKLVAAAAHDLRSPVAATRSFTATLLQTTLDEDTRRMIVEGIAYDADRMDTIVQQLVDAARIESGSFEWHPEPVDLLKLVADLLAVRALNPEYPKVTVDLASELGEVTIDAARMRSVLASLLEAVVWWASGDVALALAIEGARLRIEVTRAETSLDAEGAEGLFASRAAGSGGGSKLGLFVTRGIARAVGGDAGAEVAAPEGTLRLWADLPVGAGR